MITWLIALGTETWSLLLEMAPYLLLGFFLAGFLSVLIRQELIERWLGKRTFGSVIKASLLGIPLPLCSCGVIPVTSSLYQRSASKGATISFLTSTPQTGVDSILATVGLMGPVFAGFRVLVALVSGIAAGILVDLFEKSPTNDRTGKESKPTESIKTLSEKLREIFHYGFYRLPQDIGKTLIFGIVLAGLLSTALPKNWGGSFLGNPWLTYTAITAVAVPLYVCSTGSIPIAFALMASGVSPGAALVFLIAGPATNIATVTTLLKILGRQTIAIYLSSIVIISWISGWLLDHYGGEIFGEIVVKHHQTGTHNFVQIVSALALIAMITWACTPPLFNQRKSPTTMTDEQTSTLIIDGMTCSHCAHHVAQELMKIPGVKSAQADATQNLAWVEGVNVDLETFRNVIEEAGYKFKGILN